MHEDLLGDADMQGTNTAVRRVSVLLPLPLAGAYDYVVPVDMDVAPGDFVVAPLGRRLLPGVVWDRVEDPADAVPESKLKLIEAQLDVPSMAPAMRRFVEWVARYTLTPPGAVLRMAMSVSSALEPAKPVSVVRRAPEPPEDFKLTASRRRVLELAEDGRAWPPLDLAREAGVGPSVVKAMVQAGALETVYLPEFRAEAPRPAVTPAALSPAQQEVADDLCHQVAEGGFAVTLLDGVTGSGKTEVYFAAVAAALAQGKQALVLLPEIALSAQWVDRFRQRFGVEPALWHSDLKPQHRRRTWRRIAHGLEPVVVGARSALFLPLDRLGVIVVDEEHDSSYKQEEGVLYHARDMAVVRARLADAPIALVSATPSLETVANVAAGRYRALHLPGRHGGAELPQISAIDLRKTPPSRGRWIAPPLVQAIEETLERGEQAMLFLNRRGYAPLTLCRACGHRIQCPNCTAWLVEHRLTKKLSCHHCGFSRPVPEACPSCEATDALVPCGPGVERLGEEVAAIFPDARTALMASDLMIGPDAATDLVRAMAAREIDLLIGTQMMAKGHHFPELTLVGVVDADLGLEGGDLRAGERTYQLLHQVAGRAGRGERAGKVMLQTFSPEHPVITALVAGDRDRFIEAEGEARRLAAMPPYGRLAALIISADDPGLADQVARNLARSAPRGADIRVLGPAPAPMALLRGRHRRRLLLKVPRDMAVQPLLEDWLIKVHVPGSARVVVDIDPYSFL